ncbi:O-antigen ligase family protein [Dysosmobacter sp.]
MQRPARPKPPSPGTPRRDLVEIVYPYLLPLLLFLAVTAISRQFAVGFAAVCLVLALGREPMARLRRRASVLTLAVTLYGALCLLSGLWCHFGAYAARESVKILIALAVFALVLCRTGEDKLRRLLWSLNGVLAAAALLCVDAGSWQVLTRGFSALMKLFHSSYPLDTMGYEAGIRITGIFSNANVSAGLIAFGLILSLYLYRTAGCEKGRAAAAAALGAEALAFFLSFSMGAMAAFALTCLVYLLCEGKGRRLSLFLLMLASLAVTVACAFAATPFLGGGSIVPDLLALACGAGIWALERFVLRRAESALESRGRAVGILCGALAALACVYLVLAFQLTGSITLAGGQSLPRAIYPAAGDYTVTVQGADAQVQIYTQNEAQLMMHTNTVLYEGSLSQAAFTVPEDSRVVWFVLDGEGTLSAVTLSDGTELPLGYPLLPGFAANRLQGLRANQNFIQRLVFFQDGLKLWRQSPLIGWGIGGVEGQLTAVQSFYYESKYIHNQFIQILDEAGLLGLASFLFVLGSAIWTLWRRRKDADRDPMFAMLAAALAMMIAHSLTEVVWSAQMYQVVVFVLLAVLSIRYHQPAPGRKAAHGTALGVGLWAVVVIFAGIQASSLLAVRTFEDLENRDLSQSEFISILQRLDRMDPYNGSTYQINAMANALQTGSTTGRGIAAGYAKKLLATGEFDNCYHAAAYYYLPLRDFDGFYEAVHTGVMQEASNAAAWDSAAGLYAQACQQLEPEELESFFPSVLAFSTLLTEFNQSGRMEQIQLSADRQAFLDCVASLHDSGLTGQAAYEVLQALLG